MFLTFWYSYAKLLYFNSNILNSYSKRSYRFIFLDAYGVIKLNSNLFTPVCQFYIADEQSTIKSYNILHWNRDYPLKRNLKMTKAVHTTKPQYSRQSQIQQQTSFSYRFLTFMKKSNVTQVVLQNTIVCFWRGPEKKVTSFA